MQEHGYGGSRPQINWLQRLQGAAAPAQRIYKAPRTLFSATLCALHEKREQATEPTPVDEKVPSRWSSSRGMGTSCMWSRS